jgi:hypothetical protein
MAKDMSYRKPAPVFVPSPPASPTVENGTFPFPPPNAEPSAGETVPPVRSVPIAFLSLFQPLSKLPQDWRQTIIKAASSHGFPRDIPPHDPNELFQIEHNKNFTDRASGTISLTEESHCSCLQDGEHKCHNSHKASDLQQCPASSVSRISKATQRPGRHHVHQVYCFGCDKICC